MNGLAGEAVARNPVYRPFLTDDFGRDPPTVLVVSADRPVRGDLERGLRAEGFVVWVAANGAEAVALCRSLRGRIDMALADARMPGMDGPETMDALRAIAPAVGCCFVTSEPHLSALTQLFMRGAMYVFVKPFSVATVAAKMSILSRLKP